MIVIYVSIRNSIWETLNGGEIVSTITSLQQSNGKASRDTILNFIVMCGAERGSVYYYFGGLHQKFWESRHEVNLNF
jgi:hypothetical protein